MADFFPQAPAGQTGRGHEGNTLVVKGLIMFAVVLVAVGIVVEFCLVYVMKDFKKEEDALEALAPPLLKDTSATFRFPAPQLQAAPPVDLVKFKEAELDRLNGYGWVDRKAGIAHIPIDRAIGIVASKGLPSSGTQPEKEGAPAPTAKPGVPDTKQDGKP